MNGAVKNITEGHWAVARHIVPFLIWVGLMSLPMRDVALRYAWQVVVSLVAFLLLKPWRYYPSINILSLPLGIMVGVGVAAIWILPETVWVQQFHGFHSTYSRFFIRGNDAGNGQLYAPELV